GQSEAANFPGTGTDDMAEPKQDHPRKRGNTSKGPDLLFTLLHRGSARSRPIQNDVERLWFAGIHRLDDQELLAIPGNRELIRCRVNECARREEDFRDARLG